MQRASLARARRTHGAPAVAVAFPSSAEIHWHGSPFSGIHATIAYVAFLGYAISIVTQRFPIATITMSVALLATFMERGGYRFPPITGWATALVGWAAVGWATSAYPAIVLDRLLELTKIYAVLLVGISVVVSRPRLRTLAIVLVMSFCAYPLRGTILNYLGGETLQGRVVWNGMYSNPNDLAGLCLLFLAIALGVLVTERQLWAKAPAVVAVLLIPMVVLLSQSRGAFIALLLFALAAGRPYIRDVRRIALAIAFCIVAIAFTPDSVWERLGTITHSTAVPSAEAGEAEVSAAERLAVWQVARAIIADHPFTGVGVGAYKIAHFEYAQRPQFSPFAQGHRDTHNTYLNLLAETGVIGFLFFAGLVVSTLRNARRVRKGIVDAKSPAALQLYFLEVGAYSYLIAGLWGSYGELVFTYFYFMIVAAATHVLQKDTAGARKPAPTRARGIAYRTARPLQP